MTVQQIDTGRIKESMDCRLLIERETGREPAARSSKYTLWKCPFHHERNGHSFVVYADGWICHGRCQTSGDAISFIQKYYDMTFKEACRYLSGETVRNKHWQPVRPRSVPAPQPEARPGPDDDWKKRAGELVEIAIENLWSSRGTRAMQYLTEKRGLDPAYIAATDLGYIPGAPDDWKQVIPGWKNIPCGIIIPHREKGEVWSIRVRRAAGPDKYAGVRGNKHTLYLIDYVRPGRPLLVTEGEFDALIVIQSTTAVDVISLAGASNAKIHRRFWSRIAAAPTILVRTDQDGAGQRAFERLQKISRAVRSIEVPGSFKDINDFYLDKRDPSVIHNWIQEALNQ